MKHYKKNLFLIFVFAAILMLSSIVTIQAQIATNGTSRPAQTQNLSNYYSKFSDYNNRLLNHLGENLSATQFQNLKVQWTKQLQHNQDVIQATHGAVLNAPLPVKPNAAQDSGNGLSSLDSLNGCYIAQVSDDHISPSTDFGYISDPHAMEGDYDYNCAHLVTCGWDEDPQTHMGGEAFAASWMQTLYSGDIYLIAQRSGNSTNPPWRDIVVVMASNSVDTPFGQWIPIGEAEINSYSESMVWVGNTDGYSPFSVIAVMCWTPAPYPDPYPYPDYFNDVKIDAVYASNAGSDILAISTDGHGTTDLGVGGSSFDYGDQVEVTAEAYDNYVFDHWTLNGVTYYDDPITVTMSRSEMDLEAHFRYTGLWIYIDAYDDPWGIPVYPAIYVDSIFVGYAPAAIPVSAGYHTIYVDSTTWDYYWACNADFGYFTDYYGNGDLRPIYNDWSTTAYYYPQY